MASGLELVKVIYDCGAEECRAVFKCRFVDDDFRALGLDALHHALNGALAEVVGVRLHCQAIYPYHARVLFGAVPLAVAAVVTSLVKNGIGDEVFPRAVRFDDRLNQVFWNILVVCQELLCVLRETVATVAKGWVVVVSADSRVKPHAFDDGLRIKTFDFGISIKFIEVADTQGEVGVGEELYSFSLFHSHEKSINVFLDCALLQKSCECLGKFLCLRIAYGIDGGVFLVPLLVLIGREDLGIADNDP